jgi:protein O-GlcNAc transferase
MSPAQIQRLLQDGIVHHRAGRIDQAEALYRRARVAQPGNFDAVHLSGVVALQKGRAAEAVDFLRRAHGLAPRNLPCGLRYGLALLTTGRPAEAEPVLRAMVAIDPAAAEGWDHLAFCLKLQDQLAAAIDCHRRAVELKPSFAQAWYNFGLTLNLSSRYAESLACHERAIVANPDYAKGYYGRAQALHQLHRLPEAIAAYEEYLKREPSSHEARTNRLFALNHVDQLDGAALFAEHLAYGRAVGQWPVPAFANTPEPERRLRIAILSPDLRAHSCAYFLEPILQNLDPSRFEIYLYHDHFREDAVSTRLKSLAAVWRNFVGQTAAAVEAAIRADTPDILVDLAGHTGITPRLPLFAKHLAPVQVSYLGYPNTTGLAAMHYRFTDAVADPEGDADRFATEKLVRFAPTAWTYAAPDCAPAPTTRVPDPARITFGCFNNVAKISDRTLSLWARVLAAVPGSRLMLKGRGFGSDELRRRFETRFAAVGVPLARVDFFERTATTEEHLARYGDVDISLDTFPYHGTTTTCEALWMGVPVVTLLGDRHVSRVGGSLLTAIGHPDWIAHSDDDYVRIAATLASDAAHLATLRAGLRERVRASSLGDHAGQSARFAAALRECWSAWCSGRAASRAVA